MRNITTLLLGFVLGFYVFQYHFNVEALEDNALLQAQLSFLEGCSNGRDYDTCKELAKIHKENIESIFKATVWKN